MKKVLSVLVALSLAAVPAISLASYGGSASSINSSLTKDNCPNGDFSSSYYDSDCGDSSTPSDVTKATVDGFVYFDTDQDNVFDSWEDGLQGAVITLKTTGGSILDTDVTNSGGYYAFYNIDAGTYRIHVSCPTTNTTFVQDLLALFVPSVHAGDDYEFTVVVAEGATGLVRTDHIPLVDGDVHTNTVVDSEETVVVEEVEMDEETQSIFDLIKNANEGSDNSSYSSVGNNAGNGGFQAPAFLPATWASL